MGLAWKGSKISLPLADENTQQDCRSQNNLIRIKDPRFLRFRISSDLMPQQHNPSPCSPLAFLGRKWRLRLDLRPYTMVRKQISIEQVFSTSPTEGITTSRELQSSSESSPSVSFPSGPWKQDRWDSKALENLLVGSRPFLLILCHLTFSSQFQPDEWKRFWTISLETCLTIKLEGVYYPSIATFIYWPLLSPIYLKSIISFYFKGVYYLSVAAAGFLVFIIVLAIIKWVDIFWFYFLTSKWSESKQYISSMPCVWSRDWLRAIRNLQVYFIYSTYICRYILFLLCFIATMGKLKLWIFPNLTEDVGFFESFWPM